MDVCYVNAQVFIHSTIEGISKPKTIPTGDQARYDYTRYLVNRYLVPGIWHEVPGTGDIIYRCTSKKQPIVRVHVYRITGDLIK